MATDPPVYPYGLDVGTCVTSYTGDDPTSSGELLLDCFANTDGRNYCCTNVTSLVTNPTRRACCTYADYADQHWLGLALIKSLLLFVASTFICTLMVLSYFLVTSYDISEVEVTASRRVILKELMKKQILRKSRREVDPSSAVTGLRKISSSISSSFGKAAAARKSKEKKKNQKKGAQSTPTPSTTPSTSARTPERPSSVAKPSTATRPTAPVASKSPAAASSAQGGVTT